MSDLFIPPLSEWPRDLLYQFHERVSIKIDSGIPSVKAEAAALVEVWERREL